jgi:hypothetical protein
MKPRLEFKSLPIAFLSVDGRRVTPPEPTAESVAPSDAEIRKRAKALELAKKNGRPIRVVSFEC